MYMYVYVYIFTYIYTYIYIYICIHTYVCIHCQQYLHIAATKYLPMCMHICVMFAGRVYTLPPNIIWHSILIPATG